MKSEERLRLFIAVSVPIDLLETLGRAVSDLKSALPDGRWARVENQHVTLKFLGSSPVVTVAEIESAIGDAAQTHGPAQLRLTHLGSFPSNRKARVLWVGLQDDEGLLSALARDLDERMKSLGYEPEKRAYTPHLTVARWRAPVPVRTPWPDLPANVGAPFTVSTVELFRSHLSPKGARYEVLRDFPLTGKSARIADSGNQGAKQ
jgi:2'-5' RNA ligase